MWRRNWMPRPGAEVRALNQARHVGDDEGLLIRLLAHGDHAEVGFEGGEGVVGDLGLGGGDAGDERGLAGIGVADQADVGQQLQLQPVIALLAGAAQFVLAGAWWVGVAKCWLPRPPRPPLAITRLSSGVEKS